MFLALNFIYKSPSYAATLLNEQVFLVQSMDLYTNRKTKLRTPSQEIKVNILVT